MSLPALADFFVGRPTTSWLRYGHRKSVDLITFTGSFFEKPLLVDAIKWKYGNRFVM